MKRKLNLIAGIISLLVMNPAWGQPSGDSYGPVQKRYPLPEVIGTLFYVSPSGKEEATGTTVYNPTTLETAVSRVGSGDGIILRGGIYRTGNLMLNQDIVMQPYEDELPVIKGTYEARDWEMVVPPSGSRNGLWKTRWSRLFPSEPADWWRRELQGRSTPLHKFNNDMVFVDGRYLQSAGWLGELDEDHFYVDYENELVYIATDPSGKLVEITAFNQGLVVTPEEVHGKSSDGKGPTIRGITWTQYAFHVIDVEGYFPEGISDESEHGKDVVGTTLEHCEISYGGRVGAFLLGDHLTMRNCRVSHTSTEGVYILSSSDVLLEKNIFTRNNIEDITGYYPAAVKIFNQSHRVTCNDNLVIDHPDSNGIWYDVGNEDGVFTNNWLENVGRSDNEFTGRSVWPSRNAFFFEISKRAVVAGNVFVNNDHGILILNSSGVKVYNNTFINSTATIARDRRGEGTDHFGWHITTGPAVDQRVTHEFVNNLMVGDEQFDRPLLYVWQLPDMCEEFVLPSLSRLDNNVYVKLNHNEAPVIWYGQKLEGACVSSFSTSAELHRAEREFGSHSQSLINYKGPLFKSMRLRNLELAESMKGFVPADHIPVQVEKVLKNYQSDAYTGAYPVTPR